MNIYIVCEIEGSRIIEAFLDEQDALSFLHWEEAIGGLSKGYYTVKSTKIRNFK